MKKYAALFLAAVLSAALAACGSGTSASSGNPEPESSEIASSASDPSAESSQEESSLISPEDQADLKTISVSYRADTVINNDGKQRMIIDFENKGKKVFSGYVSVSFAGDSDILGGDIFPIKDFKPGNKGNGNVYITPDDHPAFSYQISDYTFTDDSADNSGTKNEKSSETLENYLHENFEGTKWYANIKQVEVYDNGDAHYAILTVRSQDDQSAKQASNAVFGNASGSGGADGIKLSEVIVKDQSGKELFRRSK